MGFSRYVRTQLRRVEDRYGITKQLLAALPFWLGAAAAASTAVAYAKLFTLAEHWALTFNLSHKYWMLVLAPLCFILSYLLVHFISPRAGGSGIPQLMAASELAANDRVPLNSFLGTRVVLVKISSSLLACLGGGAIGREGPTLQIAGSIFYLVRRLIPSSWGKPSLQTMILAGGGAGLAAAFNTPLGGIVYVVEELSKVHISSFRTSLLQSVIIAGLVAQAFMGSYLYLGYPVLGPVESHATFAAILIGITVGCAGALFSTCLKKLVIWRSTFRSMKASILQAAAAGLVMAILIMVTGEASMGSGKEMITTLLFDGPNLSDAQIFGRFAGPLITYAAGGAGGIFAPALAAGAALASAFHNIFQLSSALIALLGMVAFLTAVTQTPFTSFVLVLEMTDRHSALFPMMVAAMVAYTVSRIFSKHSFYDFVKERQLNDFAAASVNRSGANAISEETPAPKPL